MNKLILGSAQFGLKYGINNQNKVINLSEIKSILDLATASEIEIIDTAISYGRSEDNLGKVISNNFKIISKLPKVPKNIIDLSSWIKSQVFSSINRLGVKSLYGLLIHNSKDILGSNGQIVLKSLKDLKSSGYINKLGVSIYDPNDLKDILSNSTMDIVQSPLNLLDRRLITSGWLSRLYNEGIEVHVRSVFLQGLLLMRLKKIPSKFNKWINIFDKWNERLTESKLNATDVCLSFPLSLKEINHIVIGVDNQMQLKEIILASKKKIINQDWSFMASTDQMLINPSNWRYL